MPVNARPGQMAMDGASMRRPVRIVLLNPNTSVVATDVMLAVARRVAPPGVHVEGRTLAQGEALIAEPQSLARAGDGVVARAPALMADGFDSLIVAGFGDPGLVQLKVSWGAAVTGLGEAGIREAAEGGRRYAIVTVTPALHANLVQAAHAHAPPAQLAGVRYTRGHPEHLLQSPQDLQAALLEACEAAVRLDGAEAIVIGGGPLAGAAEALSEQLSVCVVNPVGAAVRLVCARLGISI
jgi:allantoin racemase